MSQFKWVYISLRDTVNPLYKVSRTPLIIMSLVPYPVSLITVQILIEKLVYPRFHYHIREIGREREGRKRATNTGYCA